MTTEGQGWLVGTTGPGGREEGAKVERQSHWEGSGMQAPLLGCGL